jgi:hypothetical protein
MDVAPGRLDNRDTRLVGSPPSSDFGRAIMVNASGENPNDNDPWMVRCPGCGSFNIPTQIGCSRCGHRLDEGRSPTSSADLGPERDKSGPAVDLQPVPAARSAGRPTFRISSFLLVIALVAVCMGAGHEQPFLGIALAAVALPAAVYTSVIAFRRAAAGKPMAVVEKVRSFARALAGVLVITLAALTAFCATCTPIGFAVMNAPGAVPMGIVVAFVIGGISGISAGTYAAYSILTWKSWKARKAAKP